MAMKKAKKPESARGMNSRERVRLGLVRVDPADDKSVQDAVNVILKLVGMPKTEQQYREKSSLDRAAPRLSRDA